MKFFFCFILSLTLFQATWGQTATIEGNAGGATANGIVTVVVDTDRDGLTDSLEATLGTSVTNPDTDGDGQTDKQESDAGVNPLVNQFLGNPDGSGLKNLPGGINLATGVRAVWGFEAMAAGQFTDTSGLGHHATITQSFPGQILQGPIGSGQVSRAVQFAVSGAYLRAAPAVISGSSQATMAFWIKIPTIIPTGLVVFKPIFSLQTSSTSTRSLSYILQRANVNSPFIPRIIFASGFPGNLTGSSHVVQLVNPAVTRLDDGEWHHVVVSANNSNVSVMIDGVSNSPAQSAGFNGFSGVTGTDVLIGRYLTGNTAYPFNGEFDQFLLYNRALTAAEMLALYNYDADGDGISNREELTGGSDPFMYEGDVDRDGLTNAEELAGQAVFNGVTKSFGATQRNNFDSDGDLFDDYWEAKYFFTNVKPNDPSLPMKDNPSTAIIEGDYDSDGLSNFHEMLYDSDPNESDTDGDGISDKIEVDYGSEPTDKISIPLNLADFYGDENLGSFAPIGNLGVVLKAGGDQSPLIGARVGDPSYSESERWRLRIGSKQVVAPDFGVLSDPVEIALDPSKYHEVKIEHVATDPAWLAGEGNGEPDYDYWAAIKPGSGSPFLLCDLQGLLQDPASIPAAAFLDDVDPAAVLNKTAYLVPLNNFSWATSYSGGDAVGPKHRKIALNGRPLADEKPQQEEESDQASEETYIDAFNLSLRHDTTFTYLPLASSEMVLQASASSEETGFTSRSGLKPHERLDLPFGVGWSSSLCSYIEVVETVGDESDDPIAVNVVDEAGRSQRFGTHDFQSFFPWPSTRVDRKTYQNTLVRNGTSFTLRKKYGTTLTFASSKAWFMYSSDRVDGSTTVRRHTYWRLTEARDRYGVRLQYDYDSAPGVPNPVSLIPRRISSPDREGQFLVIERSSDSRRVARVTDSRGNSTDFNYTFTNNEYAIPGGVAGAWKLNSVTFADNTQTSYTYESAVEEEVDNSDPENIRFTYHYHTNLKSVTEKRNNTHTFSYLFDQSKRYWDSSVNGSHAAVDLDRLPADVKAYVEQEIATRNEPGKGQWKTMFGQARRVNTVTLPGGIGTATFASQGGVDFNNTVTFTGTPGTTVTDAVGNVTVYAFESPLAEIVDVDASPKSISKEWMIYYLTSKIHHGGLPTAPAYRGTETYQFDPGSGLSLWRATDMSGNVTRWEFNDTYGAIPQGLPGGSPIMTRWSDPTAKIDALNRRETYTYSGSYRVMESIHDPYGTLTTYTVDGLGNRKSKIVQQNSITLLSSERYEHSNQRFKVFQTGSTQLAFSNFSGQSWETDLKTATLADTQGRLWRQIIDPGGEKLTTEHSYDFNNNRTTTRDPRGNLTRFKYDKLNRLTEVIFPSAGTRAGKAVTTKQTWYDRNGNKAAEIDEEGHYTIHHYDVLNRRITTIRDMDGAGLPSQTGDDGEKIVEEANKGSVTGNDLVTRMEYNAVGSVIRQMDPRGVVTRTFYDSIQRPIHVFTGLTEAEASGTLASLTALAASSNEKTHTELRYTDANLTFPGSGTVMKGNPGGTAFDTSGFKPTQVIRHDAALTSSGTMDLHTYAAYDALYRPLRTESEYESGVYAITGNTYGTITAEKDSLQSTVTDDRGKVTKTIMDGLQRPVTVTDGFGSALPATSQSVFSSTGLVWKTIDPLGRETETDYDASARPVAVWQPDPITGLVNRTNPNHPSLGSPRTRTAYDKNGNVTVSINPLGYRWEYQYDARNRKTIETQPTVTKTEIVAGVPQETAFQSPEIITSFDGVGNVISTTDPRGHITRSFYDPAYRAIATLTNPVTGTPSNDYQNPGADDILTQTAFDANGNILQILDGNANATRNQYDLLNRLVATATNPADGQPNAPPTAPKGTDIVVTNEYDDSGNLVKVIDGEGHLTGFRWDGLGRKTRTLWDEGSPVERTEQATFDGLVQLTRTDPKNQVTNYQYDALHRLENVLYTGAATDNRHMDYDLVGNLLEVTYPNETPARQTLREATQVFDKLNRLTQETSAGVTHSCTYDKANNRLTITYGGSERLLTSTYDKLNRLTTLAEGSASVTSYGYDLSGNTVKKTLPNGTTTLCVFDTLNRKLTEITRVTSGGLVSSFDYSAPTAGYPSGYDKVGNLLQIVEFYGRTDVKARTVLNTYDRTYRLATETLAEVNGTNNTTTYSYDKANNRASKVVTGSNPLTETSLYGQVTDGYNTNQLKTVTRSGGVSPTSFQYDTNGNRSAKLVNGVTTQTYIFDHENRLTNLTDTTLGTFAYTYDHRTRRVGRHEPGTTPTEISFSGGLSVQERPTGTATPTVETIRGSDYGGGIGGVLYTIRSGSSSYNAYNSRGDVVSKTDTSGAITYQASYEAYGTRTQEKGATLDRQKANTKDEDPTGLLNEYKRYRDLEFGIFLTRDPAGFVDGPNVYTYVRQNPWTMFDPLGLASEHEIKWKGVAADENRNFMTRIGASFMAAGEAMNPFRSDSSIRQGGRDLQVGLAEGREQLKQAPPVIREIGQFTLGVGSAGTGMMTIPTGMGEMGDSIQKQGVVETGKQMATGLVNHAVSNPVEFGGELLIGGAFVKGLKPTGNSARTITYQTQVETNQIMVKAMNGKGADVGALAATYAAESQSLHIDFVGVATKGQGIGTQLYKQALSAAGDVNEVVGTAALDNAAAISQGGILKAPRTRILQELGFTEHTYDATNATMKSKKP